MDTSEHDNTQHIVHQDLLLEPGVDAQEEANYKGGGASSILLTGSEDASAQDLPQILDTDIEKGIITNASTGETVVGGNDSSESDDGMVLVGDSWVEESSTLVCVPVPGIPLTAEVVYVRLRGFRGIGIGVIAGKLAHADELCGNSGSPGGTQNPD